MQTLQISSLTDFGNEPLHMPANAPLDDVHDRLHALDIDLSCALRFSRVALQVLAAVSDEARQAIDRSLAEEIAMTHIEEMDGSAAVAAILSEARHHIASPSHDNADDAARFIERLLVERAAELTSPSAKADSEPLRASSAGR